MELLKFPLMIGHNRWEQFLGKFFAASSIAYRV
jgi:hypothetical protein